MNLTKMKWRDVFQDTDEFHPLTFKPKRIRPL